MQFDERMIKSTITETSKDNSGQSVVDSYQEVYDFDKITEEVALVYRMNRPQCSCDALFVKDTDNIYLVEFKNVRCSRVEKKQLCCKAYDSIMTLQMAFFPQYSIEQLKDRTVMVVVYNDDGVIEKEQESKAFDKMKKKLAEWSGNEKSILFGLEIYKELLYRNIITVEKKEYIDRVHPYIFGYEK